MRWLALLAGATGLALFQFFGNATRGYVDTASLFRWWFSQWLDPRAETEHGWLILGISFWLFWRNLSRPADPHLQTEGSFGSLGPRRPRRGDVEPDNPAPEDAIPLGTRRPRRVSLLRGLIGPFSAVLGGLALHAAGFIGQQTRISIIGFLLFSWGIVALADRRWGRAAAFPLGFLAFAIPLSVLDSLGFWLRLWVIDAGTGLAHLAGINVLRSGTQLFAADGRYEYDVAAACSGVRSLMALAALSLLIGYVSFRSQWRRGFLFLMCFPLTYVGNLLRISAIIVAAQWGGQRWGERAHDFMGYGVFILVLGGVWVTASLLRWASPELPITAQQPPDEIEPPIEASRRPALFLFIVIPLVLGEMVALSSVSSSARPGEAGVRLSANGIDPAALPAFVGTEWMGRRAEVTPLEREILPADTGFSRRNYISLTPGAAPVFLSIVLSGRDRTSIHRPELCLVGQGWTIQSVGQHDFGANVAGVGGIPTTLLRTQLIERGTQRGRTALVAYFFMSSDGIVASHWERFWRDVWKRLRHGRADRWAYVLMQTDATDGEVAALARMQSILAGTFPTFYAANGTRW
jgi:exosortase